MVSDGLRRFPMVSNGFRQFPTASDSLRESPMVSEGIRWYPTVADLTLPYLTWPGIIRVNFPTMMASCYLLPSLWHEIIGRLLPVALGTVLVTSDLIGKRRTYTCRRA